MQRDGSVVRRRTMFRAIAILAATPATASEQPLNKTRITGLEKVLSKEMADPVARFGLVEFAYAFRNARIKTSPLGYENTERFKRKSLQVAVGLQKILTEAPILKPVSKEFIAVAGNAYDKNKPTIIEVYARVRKAAFELANLPDEMITGFQLRITIILYSKVEELLKIARSVTCVYPFC